MKNKIRYFVSALAIISLGVMPLASCGKKHETKTAAPSYNPATKFNITKQVIEDQKSIAAFYTSVDASAARARIGGTLVSLLVNEGDYVKQGQTLAVIDEARYAAEAAAGRANASAMQSAAQAGLANARQAPAQLQAARANAQRAQADYNRTKSLFDQGVYAQARLDQMQAALAAANAQVAAAQAGVGAANANAQAAQAQAQSARAGAMVAEAVRAQGRIIAPKDGRITAIMSRQGTVLMPGEVVLTIAAGAPVLRLFVPERDAGNLRIGQSVNIYGNDGQITHTTNINKIYPNSENGQVQVDLDSDGTEHFSGERVNISVPTGQREAIIVPRSYVISRQGSDYVRLLSGNLVLEIPIQRGQTTSSASIKDGVEVLSGLNAGDVIVAPNNQIQSLNPTNNERRQGQAAAAAHVAPHRSVEQRETSVR